MSDVVVARAIRDSAKTIAAFILLAAVTHAILHPVVSVLVVKYSLKQAAADAQQQLEAIRAKATDSR